MEPGGAKPRTRVGGVIAAAVVIVGVLAGVAAVLQYIGVDWPWKADDTVAVSSAEPSAQGDGGSTPATSQTPAAEPTAQESAPEEPTEEGPSAAAVPPAALSRFQIEVDLLASVPIGYRVGPSLFSLNDEGALEVTFSWDGLRSDGTLDETESCQILASVAGPAAFPSTRYADCTRRPAGNFNGAQNRVDIREPGVYTITVRDELTGTVGKQQFTVTTR